MYINKEGLKIDNVNLREANVKEIINRDIPIMFEASLTNARIKNPNGCFAIYKGEKIGKNTDAKYL